MPYFTFYLPPSKGKTLTANGMGSGIVLAMLFPAIHAWLIRPGEGEWTVEKQPIRLFDFWQETMSALVRDGLLLCSVGRDGQPNVMTIGWMTGGVV